MKEPVERRASRSTSRHSEMAVPVWPLQCAHPYLLAEMESLCLRTMPADLQWSGAPFIQYIVPHLAGWNKCLSSIKSFWEESCQTGAPCPHPYSSGRYVTLPMCKSASLRSGCTRLCSGQHQGREAAIVVVHHLSHHSNSFNGMAAIDVMLSSKQVGAQLSNITRFICVKYF